uniref:Cytochrome c oxidase subunit 2 n=1 Tax=Seison sp. MS-2015 TaxID=1673261 RepID=A0A678N4L3_9BILA|nr:cytochrome c oxidase subunit II [Seison sp. MS-2015]
MAIWNQLSFQDSMNFLMHDLSKFHDEILFYMVMIMVLVFYVYLQMLLNKKMDVHVIDSHGLEFFWTFVPCLILLMVAYPSLKLLYVTEDSYLWPNVTVKVIGRQWYWSYEYSNFDGVSFDSYMVPTEDLSEGEFRLLEVDNRVVMPVSVLVRLLVTASDVIHSWTIPSLGVKADGIPGRLNQLNFMANNCGVFYGQCSELCGVNHSFMPIAVEVVSLDDFLGWVLNFE